MLRSRLNVKALFPLITFLAGTTLPAEDLSKQAAQVLHENCLGCHGEALKMSHLDLRSRESILIGGDGGPALIPGKPSESRLLRFVSGIQQPSMPPGKPLPAAKVEILRRWIESGARLEESAPARPDERAAIAALEDRPITAEERRYWAFQPPARPAAPTVRRADWARNPIDAFLLAALEAKGLQPSPPADRRTLVRRAYLDLTGLPPDPAAIDEFVKDSSADAWPSLVNRLLDSPHYGERWGRHWLDLVRYADSGGYEIDRDRPNIWRYRDYVIRAFNQDKPYDEFIREQIAGDEIDPGSHDALIATGFLRNGLEANMKTEQTRMDELDDLISTSTGAFLGMTAGCARCHNHKFDPIPQKDYYRMQAVFFSTQHEDLPLVGEVEVASHKAEQKRIDGLEAPLKKERTALQEPYRNALLAKKKARLPEYIQVALRTPEEMRTEGQRLNASQVEKTLRIPEPEILAALPPSDAARDAALRDQIARLEQERPAPFPAAMGIAEKAPRAEPAYFLHRGSPGSKGSLMTPGVLSAASRAEVAFPEPTDGTKSSMRRATFAAWVASTDNPLTSRVMVNRIWQHHFGEGIVPTPSNFGKSGLTPTHPELLDWLAVEFMRQRWSVKAVHRLILTSNAWQMASDDIQASAAIDPSNRLLWRMPRRRLEGELIRDSILAVAGTLDRKTGGPPIHPYIDPALWQSSTGRTWPGKPDSDPETWRRSVYVSHKRTIPLPMLEVFDKPDAAGSCARRNRSTIAPQALMLMNNSSVGLHARYFAQRLEREAAGVDARVDRAYRLALGRSPSASERSESLDFIRSSPYGLVDFCQALFNLNEFVYIP